MAGASWSARAFQQHVGKGRAGRAEHDGDSTPESEEPAEIEQTRADQRDAADREQRSRHPLPAQRFARQKVMREDHPENWNGRLQNRGQTGRHVQLRPEKQRVVHREHEHAGVGQQFEIAAPQREQSHPADGDGQKDSDGDGKPERHERNRRQIAQADLDREPGRTPDHAEREIRRGDGKFSLLRHRVSAHQVIRVATAFAVKFSSCS